MAERQPPRGPSRPGGPSNQRPDRAGPRSGGPRAGSFNRDGARAERGGERVSERGSERSFERGAARGPARGPDRGPDRSADRGPARGERSFGGQRTGSFGGPRSAERGSERPAPRTSGGYDPVRTNEREERPLYRSAERPSDRTDRNRGADRGRAGPSRGRVLDATGEEKPRIGGRRAARTALNIQSNRGESGPRKGERIAKLLARAGVGSRRDIERMITDGRVALDGKILDTPATVLTTLKDVLVDGKPVEEAQATRLFLFHKPSGTLTAARDYGGRATIYDVLPIDLPRLVPVGRLDLNTEGLLLMTNDGELKRALELPINSVPRTYRVRALGQVRQQDLEQLALGVTIEGVRYGPVDASVDRRARAEGANIWLTMTLTEGKNREVRKLCEAMGLRVSRLIRTHYGPFSLDDLPVRGVQEATAAQVNSLQRTLARSKAPPKN